MTLDVISCQLTNLTKKKGAVPRNPDEQFQPDYVKEAKAAVESKRKGRVKLDDGDLAEMADFWHKRNPKVRYLEE